MFKNIKSMLQSIKLMGIESMFPFMILLTTFINIMNIRIGYNMDFLSGLWSPVSMIFVMALLVMTTMIAMNYVNHYKLLIAMPMKLDKTPVQMMMLLDFTFLIITLIDVIVMAISGYGYAVLLKVSVMLAIYAASCILFYVSVRTGFKFYGTIGKVLSAIVCFMIYAICAVFYIAVLVLIQDHSIDVFGDNMRLLWIFIACGVLAAAVRILSYMGVKNCVRQRKIYKTKTGHSKIKVESYV